MTKVTKIGGVMDIEGATAFISGASGGLGAMIATKLAEAGADIAVGYRESRERAEQIAGTVISLGQHAVLVQLDQTSVGSIDTAVEEASKALGGLDLLVNNAGGCGPDIAAGDLEALTPEIWDELMVLNVRGPYLLARAAAPLLRGSKWGRIVNIGSTIGHGTWGVAESYAPSKASVSPLTRFLAAALAPDVTVNCVAPGLIEDTGLSSGMSEEAVNNWKHQAVLRSTTSMEDVAEQVVAFCKCETITGQVLVVDGGIHFD